MSKLYESSLSNDCQHSFKMILKKLTKLDKSMTFDNKLQVVIFSLNSLNIDNDSNMLRNKFMDTDVLNSMLDEIIHSVHIISFENKASLEELIDLIVDLDNLDVYRLTSVVVIYIER